MQCEASRYRLEKAKKKKKMTMNMMMKQLMVMWLRQYRFQCASIEFLGTWPSEAVPWHVAMHPYTT